MLTGIGENHIETSPIVNPEDLSYGHEGEKDVNRRKLSGILNNVGCIQGFALSPLALPCLP
jgi:hypothetical protein